MGNQGDGFAKNSPLSCTGEQTTRTNRSALHTHLYLCPTQHIPPMVNATTAKRRRVQSHRMVHAFRRDANWIYAYVLIVQKVNHECKANRTLGTIYIGGHQNTASIVQTSISSGLVLAVSDCQQRKDACLMQRHTQSFCVSSPADWLSGFSGCSRVADRRVHALTFLPLCSRFTELQPPCVRWCFFFTRLPGTRKMDGPVCQTSR